MKRPEVTEWPKQPLEYDRDIPDEGEGHGWIQWKGTSVCIDVRCRCGTMGHYDGTFLYFYRCTACGVTFSVGQTVRLYPIAAAHVEQIAGDRAKVSEE